MEISKEKSDRNPNYLGWDEDHNGDWNDFYMCPKCKESNYIVVGDKRCTYCGERLEWK